MSFSTIVAGIAGLILLNLTWDHLASVRALRRRPLGRPPGIDSYPSVTVIRPVKGTDSGQAENFRAALDTGYGGEVETIFVFEDEADPGHPLAVAAVEEHTRAGRHGGARVVLSGSPRPGFTGKIHNMIAGVQEAHGSLIAFGDSDTRPDDEVLGNLVAHLLADPKAGAAFAPPVAATPPRTAGDVGHHIVLNAYLTAGMEVQLGPDRELPFLMGQLMLFRREALEAIGGVESAEGQLVDDMFLGGRLVDEGYRNVVGTHVLRIMDEGLRFTDFLRLWRRWLFCGRGGIPLSFVWAFAIRATSFFVGLGLMIAAAVAGPAWVVIPPLTVVTLEGLHYLRLHRIHGGAPVPARWLWMVWMPYLAALPLIVSMLIRPELEWRGHTYRVDRKARLAG
ncbi:MAG: glycosyltransferase [Gemmatimonadota bacterium]|nr:glycosyltransferase [Gemmatimonadota bacterium]